MGDQGESASDETEQGSIERKSGAVVNERESPVVVIVLTYLYSLKLVRVFVYAGTRVRDTSTSTRVHEYSSRLQ